MPLFPQLFDKRSVARYTGGLNHLSDFWYDYTGGGPTNAGTQVNEKTALRYLTVFSCVSLIAGDIAKLPLILYRRKSDDSKERITNHPLYDLMHNAPNPEMDSFNWREAQQGHLLLWGNAVNLIQRNRFSGEISAIWPINDPSKIEIRRDPKGKIYYEWMTSNLGAASIKADDPGQANYLWIKGKKVLIRRRPAKEIFHIPGFGFNGVMGMSMIGIARESVGLGLAAQEFHSRFFGDGTHPSLVVSIPPEVQAGGNIKEYKERLKTEISGLKQAHGIAVFNNGEKVDTLTMPLKDAQFLETTQASDMRICGFYHVPPHKAALFSKNANRNNLEEENKGYVDSCLSHWVTRWEKAISHQLLTPEERRDGLFFEFNLAGLLRGDTQARSELYKTMFGMGYPLNKILAKENENPVDGGDVGYIQMNLIPIDKAVDMADSQIEGGNGGNGPETKDLRDTREKIRAMKAEVERRSILLRDRILDQYYPLFIRAAQKIVNREGIAVKKQIGKEDKERSKTSMQGWLDSFYREMPEYIKREIGPVFRSFSMAIAESAADEIGVELDQNELRQFTADYIDRYAARHAGGSLGQLTALLRDKELTDLEERVDEWEEKRPEKIADNETVRASNAVFSMVAYGAGMGVVWRIRGAKTCPYCREFNGRKVRSGESFVQAGDEVDPKGGTGPMKIRGMKAHPPLHQGCDCYLSGG